MTDREYNGFTNQDTYAFALWIDNVQHTHFARMLLCQEIVDTGGGCTELSKSLCIGAKELLMSSGCTDDIDLAKVSFDEIADHWIEDAEEPESAYDRQQRENDEAGDIAMRFEREERDD